MNQEVHTKIKPITDEDVPKVIDLLRQEGMGYGSVERYRAFFYKVLVDGAMVACLALFPRHGFMEIKSLVVRREHRSCRIFTRVSEFSASKALAQRIPCVVIKVSKHNQATMLYRRRGFVPMCPDRYADIYQYLRRDCIAGHSTVQAYYPLYMIIDMHLLSDSFRERQEQAEEFV